MICSERKEIFRAPTGVDTEPLTRSCYPEPLHAVTDVANADYGRVPCVVLDAGRAETPFCECTQPGHRPVTAAQDALAREHLETNCRGSCCDDLSFCELLQFSGDELAYCQDRASEPATQLPIGGAISSPPQASATRVGSTSVRRPSLDPCSPGQRVVNRLAVFACLS